MFLFELWLLIVGYYNCDCRSIGMNGIRNYEDEEYVANIVLHHEGFYFSFFGCFDADAFIHKIIEVASSKQYVDYSTEGKNEARRRRRQTKNMQMS